MLKRAALLGVSGFNYRLWEGVRVFQDGEGGGG